MSHPYSTIQKEGHLTATSPHPDPNDTVYNVENGYELPPASPATWAGYPSNQSPYITAADYGELYASYNEQFHTRNTDTNGKYSTGSEDSGLHSNSPVPVSESLSPPLSEGQMPKTCTASRMSLNSKKIRNETYV